MSSRSITPVRPLLPVPSRDAVELVNTQASGGFVSFQYSYTEVSSRDGRTHVQSNTTRLADGKVTREAFEGELEGDAYGQAVEETQWQMTRSLARPPEFARQCKCASAPASSISAVISTFGELI